MKMMNAMKIAIVSLCSVCGLSAATLTQCPAASVAGTPYTGCNFLITENASGTFTTTVDTSQPFFGGEDNYAGFQNNTAHPVSSLVINGNGTTLFAFDGDGPTPITPATPTGYEGPNNTFSNISADLTTGTINFTTPIAAGGSAYFYLEEALSATGPLPIGGNGTPEPATFGLMGGAFLGMAGYAFKRRRLS